jgi:hypothetical protein
MNGKMMWTERFLKEGSVKQDSYGQNYEVWIPVHWMTEPTEDLLKKLEATAKVASGTVWRPKYCGPALRWISDRSFNRIEELRYKGSATGHILETYVVLNEREAMAD